MQAPRDESMESSGLGLPKPAGHTLIGRPPSNDVRRRVKHGKTCAVRGVGRPSVPH